MIFQVGLYGFHLGLKTVVTLASWRNKAFRQRLKERNFLIQVRTKNDNKGRYYKLVNGKFKSAGKVLEEEPDIVVIWADFGTALRTFIKFTPASIVASIMDAISTGKLAVEAKLDATYWFGLTMFDMINVYRGAGKQAA